MCGGDENMPTDADRWADAEREVKRLKAKNAKLTEALKEQADFLAWVIQLWDINRGGIVLSVADVERMRGRAVNVKATLAAGEGEKAPPEPQSRSQERRFKVQGDPPDPIIYNGMTLPEVLRRLGEFEAASGKGDLQIKVQGAGEGE